MVATALFVAVAALAAWTLSTLGGGGGALLLAHMPEQRWRRLVVALMVVSGASLVWRQRSLLIEAGRSVFGKGLVSGQTRSTDLTRRWRRAKGTKIYLFFFAPSCASRLRVTSVMLTEQCPVELRKDMMTRTRTTSPSMRFDLQPYTVCSFCEDLEGRRHSAFVLRGSEAAAIVNERQYERGAILIVPTRHCESILDISETQIDAVYRLARRIAEAAVRAFDAVGVNVFQNNGTAAGQSEPHFHVHVVPRYPGSDPNRRFHRSEFDVVSLAEQQAIAAAVRAAL